MISLLEPNLILGPQQPDPEETYRSVFSFLKNP